MDVNEYKELNEAYKKLSELHLDTAKELSRIVREQAKLLEQTKESKYDTCCKYITISVIAIALFATIVLCCIYGQRNKIECVHDIVKVQISKENIE